jgi:hypothetical protein
VAVAAETMHRARHNAELLMPRLDGHLGKRFRISNPQGLLRYLEPLDAFHGYSRGDVGGDGEKISAHPRYEMGHE